MATRASNAREKLNQANAVVTTNQPKPIEVRVREGLQQMLPELQAALPATGLTPERLARVALTTIKTNTDLLRCDIRSLFAAVVQAAQLGLEPGLLGMAYIVPFGNQAQLVIGYKGILQLVRRSNEVANVSAHVVYEKDEFEIEYGLNERLVHKPCMTGDRGPSVAYYSVLKFKDGSYHIHVLSRAEAERVRDRYAKGAGRTDSPWRTEFDTMALKTCIRQASKFWPLTLDDMRRLSADGSVKVDFAADMLDVASVVDTEAEAVDNLPESEAEQPQEQPQDGKERTPQQEIITYAWGPGLTPSELDAALKDVGLSLDTLTAGDVDKAKHAINLYVDKKAQ